MVAVAILKGFFSERRSKVLTLAKLLTREASYRTA